MKDNKAAVLVVVDTSWGAIDWILPLLVGASHRLNKRVFVYFTHEYYLVRGERYEDLVSLLEQHHIEIIPRAELARELNWQQRLQLLNLRRKKEAGQPHALKRYVKYLRKLIQLPLSRRCPIDVGEIPPKILADRLRERLAGFEVEYVLHDFENNEAMYSAFPQATVVLFPHGTNWIVDEHFQRAADRGFERTLGQLPSRCFALAGLDLDGRYQQFLGADCPYFVSGNMRLDSDWTSFRFGSQATRSKADKRLLFLSIPAHKAPSEAVFGKMVRSVCQVALKEEARLWIKLHPNQFAEQVEKFIPAEALPLVEWCNESALSAASQVDLAISFPSSAVLDVIATGTPVIEYFDFEAAGYLSFITAGQDTSSIYRQSELVKAANNERELKQAVQRILSDRTHRTELVQQQTKALGRIHEREGTWQRMLRLLWNDEGIPRPWSEISEELEQGDCRAAA